MNPDPVPQPAPPTSADAGTPHGPPSKPPASPRESYSALVDPESRRLAQDARRAANWKRWGPYLAERQWGTVREDYSADGDCWDSFPHEQARSRAYRWGEDGLLGWTDRECRLCFGLALWNGQDRILKERLFGLTNPQGNCGEDVKEAYFYLDSTPTHSYVRGLYKYPHAAFPYDRLLDASRQRPREQGEFELADTGVFDGGAYFDVQAEYAKDGPDDTLIRVTVTNKSPAGSPRRPLAVLPTLWFRNTWSWGWPAEESPGRPSLRQTAPGRVRAEHSSLGAFWWEADAAAGPAGPVAPTLLFTDNDTNGQRLFGAPNPRPWVKDAFHRYVIEGETGAVNPALTGTKAAALYRFELAGGESAVIRLRLRPEPATPERPRSRSARPSRRRCSCVVRRRMCSTPASCRARCPRSVRRSRGRRTPACSGTSSSIATWCTTG